MEPDGDEMFDLLFRSKKPRKSGKERKPRKNAITEEEVLLYRKGMNKKGNDWKELVKFFVEQKDILSSDLGEKYEAALQQINNKEAVKPIRNRLGNIGRKAKDSPEVKHRESRNIIQGNESTAEELVKKMKSIRQEEANDPLNAESSSQSDDETAESKKSTTDPQPCCSKSPDALESDSDEPAIPPKVRKVEKSSQSKAEKRKRSATTSNKFKKLTARADKLMSIGMQAAKLHMKYLKETASSQGVEISLSSESQESSDDH